MAKGKDKPISSKRQIEIVMNIETVKPANESEKRFIAQVKKIQKDGGVVELPFD